MDAMNQSLRSGTITKTEAMARAMKAAVLADHAVELLGAGKVRDELEESVASFRSTAERAGLRPQVFEISRRNLQAAVKQAQNDLHIQSAQENDNKKTEMIDGSQAQNAPFGTRWGATVESMKEDGVSLVQQGQEGPFTSFTAKSLPRDIANADYYVLTFHDKQGLQKIRMVSEDITDDLYGSKGKTEYERFKDALNSRYSGQAKAASVERTGVTLYKSRSEFYQCLEHPGCGVWLTIWRLMDARAVGLQIRGLGRARGLIQLDYEGPLWSTTRDAYKDSLMEDYDRAL